jgi:membrane protein YqaA with SNARE-associated domain
MRLWLILIGTLIIQEIATTNVVLLEAHRAGDSGWIIFGIFLLATTFDLFVGYVAGKWVQKRFAGAKLVKRAEREARRFEKYLGTGSERATLALIGFVSYAYVNSFLASWLEISATEACVFLFIGDLGWYALEWLLVLGIRSTSSNISTELYLAVGVSLVFIIGLRFLANYLFKDR